MRKAMSNLVYKLNPMPAKIPQEKLDRLARLETATIGHFYHYGFVSPSIQPVLPAGSRFEFFQPF